MMGSLICFEGVDGVGKSTVINRTSQLLTEAKIDFAVFKFPSVFDYGKIATASGNSHCSPFLHLADMIDCQPYLNDLLCKHDIVLLDRYWLSTIVYGSEKVHGIRELIDKNQLIKPNLTLLIECPIFEIRKRLTHKALRDEFEDKILSEQDHQILKKILHYRRLIKEMPCSLIYENVEDEDISSFTVKDWLRYARETHV